MGKIGFRFLLEKTIAIVTKVYCLLLWLRWPLHDEQPGQYLNEDPSHPWGHNVGLQGPEVDVEHNYSHTYAAIQDTISSRGSAETGSGC